MGLIYKNHIGNYNQREDLLITEMREEDIEEVLSIENRCFNSPWKRTAFEQELCLAWSKILVARKSNQYHNPILGYICLWFLFNEVHILNIATIPDFRRQGVATCLMNSCIEFSLHAGVKTLTLEVRKSNLPAISFYKKYGFEPRGVRPRYYSDNHEDAYVMWLTL
ncbi:MAG: ribosomal protein S18-alanine N-acetyltransferase [Thermodesulfobacteriota bacterium]|nr:ribosomal protein S18-alanine N-acetyltransferase [Thermodesulfobacteriota bacterium]